MKIMAMTEPNSRQSLQSINPHPLLSPGKRNATDAHRPADTTTMRKPYQRIYLIYYRSKMTNPQMRNINHLHASHLSQEAFLTA